MAFYSLAGTKLRYCSSRVSRQLYIGCGYKKAMYTPTITMLWTEATSGIFCIDIYMQRRGSATGTTHIRLK